MQEQYSDDDSFEDENNQYQDSVSDTSSELNPFMFELNYDTKKWELIDAFFDRILNGRPSVYVNILRKVKHQLQKIRLFTQTVQKDHENQIKLKRAYDQLKQKNLTHDQLLISIEKGYTIQIDELRDELYKKEQEMKNLKVSHNKEVIQLQDRLEDQFEKNQGMKQELSMLLEKYATLSEKTQELENMTILSQTEVQQIKTIKSGGYLVPYSKRDTYFSTLELVMASKVKTQIVRFFQISDLLMLCRTSKRLYFAIISLKIMVPQIVFCKTSQLQGQIQILSYQKNQLENLQNSCSNQTLLIQMVKCYQLFYNPTEMIQVVLNESNNLISGQLLGITQDMSQGEDTTGLSTFMKQISTRAFQCIKELKTNQLNWSQFCVVLQQTEKDIKNVNLGRQTLQKTLRLKSQDVQEQLFNMGSYAASDPSLFGSYLTQLQKCYAQLFTFSTQLTIETQQIMGLVYYMAIQYWNVLEKDKITVDIFERQKLDLESALTIKDNLQERMKQMDLQLLHKDIKQRELTNKFEREQKLKEQIQVEMESQKLTMQNQTTYVKNLAQKLQDQLQKNKDITIIHDKNIFKFRQLRQQIEQLVDPM